MTRSNNIRDLRVWDAARILAGEVSRARAGDRSRGTAELWDQARRAAESVGANIAEGCGRSTDPDRRRCFVIAQGSLRETQHHLRRCREEHLISEALFPRLIGLSSVTRRMLDALIARLR